MDIQNILADLKSEREDLDRAIGCIGRTRYSDTPSGKTGRQPSGRGHSKRKRRHMSAASRKRISEMMKQRWAERKRKAR